MSALNSSNISSATQRRPSLPQEFLPTPNTCLGTHASLCNLPDKLVVAVFTANRVRSAEQLKANPVLQILAGCLLCRFITLVLIRKRINVLVREKFKNPVHHLIERNPGFQSISAQTLENPLASKSLTMH